MKTFSVITFFVLLISCSSPSTNNYVEENISIIPKPASIALQKGTFVFNKNTRVIADISNVKTLQLLDQKLGLAAGFNLLFKDEDDQTPSSNIIELVITNEYPTDGYELKITNSKVSINASDYGGFLYGVQSLIQLLPAEIESKSIQPNIDWQVPSLVIQDEPRFKWRGLMLDVSRHFYGKDYLKKIIDGLAMHKMNVLHLHLVDDQGWRIEIKKYPKLTEVGGWRVDQEQFAWNGREKVTANEKGTYGGFLSQEDLKEIVQYAAQNNVEVIPEIEMPAHVSSAIASYSFLSCNETPIGVPSGGVWPITDIYCAGKESTFEFLEDVLIEVMDIFPSQYIHIGGDEATKTNWKNCEHCLRRMEAEGLHDMDELQSYFVKRMEKFINANGKKLIGWDEILEGGLAPDATVMSWRGVKGGFEASAQGHDVVMTPGTHCYFDHYQGPQNQEPLAIGGYTPLSKVYQFDPVVDTMTSEQAAHVLGGQANLWSEYITSEEHSEYMIFPRLAALSEAVWSPKELRDWNDFSARLPALFKRYDYRDINYAKSAYLITSKAEINLESKILSLSLQSEFANADIRYVLGDGYLNKNSIKYKNPIDLATTTSIKAAVFKSDTIFGKPFTDTIRFHKAVASSVKYVKPNSTKYKGAGKFNLVNAIRGTKNFHDGQWQGWLNDDMEVVIDLLREESIHQVTVGALENQSPWIYFPIAVEVYVSDDAVSFKKVGSIKRSYVQSSNAELKDFVVNFEELKTSYVKVIAINLKESPKGSGVWMFIDEILVE